MQLWHEIVFVFSSSIAQKIMTTELFIITRPILKNAIIIMM